jgi:hypothetical protein
MTNPTPLPANPQPITAMQKERIIPLKHSEKTISHHFPEICLGISKEDPCITPGIILLN